MLSVSDTRTIENDESGAFIQGALLADRHTVVGYAICKDEPDLVVQHVKAWIAKGAQVVITTGGTGIAPRDTTFEAIERLVEKRLDGFGELFRALSYKEIGAAAMLSRATAGTLRGGGFVFALPGSANAVRLAMKELILPELAHVAWLARPR